MKILVLTDTHGDIEVIEDLVAQEAPDLCVHCGDFGFYDAQSVDRLTVRELRLRWKHSHLPRHLRKLAWKMDPDELRRRVKQEGLLSTFVPWLSGERRFSVPLYAVWGNHEDVEVVRALAAGEPQVPNLTLLDDAARVDLGEDVQLFGLGGNVYLDGAEGLFAPGLTGHGGKIRASWTEHARLLRRMLEAPPAQHRLLVTHVSPGKCRLIERLALVAGATLCFSGHMGPPTHHAWSLFTVCEPPEALARSQGEFEALRESWWAFEGKGQMSPDDVEAVEASLTALDLEPLPPRQRGRRPERGSVEDHYRRTQFFNLTDVAEGWGVLELEGGQARWQGRQPG